MKAELAIAGLGCFVLAFGHTAIGARWVLPDLREAHLAGTPFGPPALTLSMLRFTWRVVSIMLVGFGVLLMALAFAPDADPETLLLRWLTVFWLVAAATALWDARRRMRSVLRFPVPLAFLFLATMCWLAST
jgi:hypothetical protein